VIFYSHFTTLQVEGDASDTGKTSFADFKSVVWHESFHKILASISAHSVSGHWHKCADGVSCHFFLLVLILSADYEEQ
jgi:hypothetical protein